MILSPKEKAEELLYKFMNKRISWKQSKLCVLISVDEIINSTPSEPNFADWDDCGGEHRYFYHAQKEHALHFWQEVKKEIQNL